ncbi:MAG: hypothetical protein U1F98_03020 [Verrucomicrobiota bacterium]
MNPSRARPPLWTLLALICLLPACASLNVDPRHPEPGVGYVDLYTPTPEQLSWDVREFNAADNAFKPVFSDIDPVQGRILRLAFPPGTCRLRITFLNRVIIEPVILDVTVDAGRITPVEIDSKDEGDASVYTIRTGLGSTAYGHLGRHTRVTGVGTPAYRLTGKALPPVDYQVKSKMPYDGPQSAP